VNVEIQDIYLA